MSTDPPKTSWKREAPFRLGDLEVLPASGELRGRRGVERLRPLLMDILLRLAAEPGVVVRRETLLEDVWPRRMVNDEVLSRAIAELRTALGDDPRVARYIETLPKLGYRLVAAVEPLTPPEAAPPPSATQDVARKPMRPSSRVAAAAVLLLAVIGGGWWLAARNASPPGAGLEARLLAARPFTSDPILELSPRFSPDGRRVVFTLAETGGSRIVVQDLDGAARQLVGGERDGVQRLGPVFFPDGRRIAYWRATRGGCAIVEHDLASGAERTVLDCARQPRSRFDLSADGQWLVFAAATRPQFPAGLWLLEVDRGTPMALTTPEPGEGEDLFPRFSPDGRRVAFFRGGESHRQPWIVDRAGGPARAIAKIDGLAYGLAWLGPEGPLLAAADWFGFRALNLVDVASGTARLAGARGARFPDVGPRGEVVFENAVYASNLWPLDPRTGPATAPRWLSTRYSSQPEISPDGKLVVFASNRDGSDAIYVAPLDGEARRIAFGDAYRYLRPHWSADSRSVYAVRTSPGAGATSIQEAVRIPAGGGTPEVIAELGRAVNDVREGGDGKLYWGELSGQAMRLLRAPLDSPARGERLPLPLVSQYQVSSGRLAFTQPQLTTLTLCRLDTLACEPTPLYLPEPDIFHWTLAARSVYLRERAAGEVRLARYDIESRRIAQTWPFPPTGTGASIAATPAEDLLLVAREEGPAIDLMLAR